VEPDRRSLRRIDRLGGEADCERKPIAPGWRYLLTWRNPMQDTKARELEQLLDDASTALSATSPPRLASAGVAPTEAQVRVPSAVFPFTWGKTLPSAPDDPVVPNTSRQLLSFRLRA
jgi:hypothetical protein